MVALPPPSVTSSSMANVHEGGNKRGQRSHPRRDSGGRRGWATPPRHRRCPPRCLSPATAPPSAGAPASMVGTPPAPRCGGSGQRGRRILGDAAARPQGRRSASRHGALHHHRGSPTARVGLHPQGGVEGGRGATKAAAARCECPPQQRRGQVGAHRSASATTAAITASGNRYSEPGRGPFRPLWGETATSTLLSSPPCPRQPAPATLPCRLPGESGGPLSAAASTSRAMAASPAAAARRAPPWTAASAAVRGSSGWGSGDGKPFASTAAALSPDSACHRAARMAAQAQDSNVRAWGRAGRVPRWRGRRGGDAPAA